MGPPAFFLRSSYFFAFCLLFLLKSFTYILNTISYRLYIYNQNKIIMLETLIIISIAAALAFTPYILADAIHYAVKFIKKIIK